MKRKLAAMTTVVVSMLFGIVHAEGDVLTPALSEQANSDVAALASQEKINSFAKDCGCEHLEGYGRKAWSKVLKKYKWEPEYIAYRMELGNG